MPIQSQLDDNIIPEPDINIAGEQMLLVLSLTSTFQLYVDVLSNPEVSIKIPSLWPILASALFVPNFSLWYWLTTNNLILPHQPINVPILASTFLLLSNYKQFDITSPNPSMRLLNLDVIKLVPVKCAYPDLDCICEWFLCNARWYPMFLYLHVAAE